MPPPESGGGILLHKLSYFYDFAALYSFHGLNFR
jgi:hypothetical protein